MDDASFNSVFFLSLAGIVFGSVHLCLRYMFRSKCDNVEICCFKIHRNVDIEAPDTGDLSPNTNIVIRQPSNGV